MTFYTWHGINPSGKKIRGIEQTRNRKLLKTNLLKKNIFPTKISLNFSHYCKLHHKLKTKEITYFLEQLSLLTNANIPILKIFSIISQDEQNYKLKVLAANFKKSITEGKSLFQTIQAYPQYFNELTCSLINAGEQSGTIDITLSEIVSSRKKIELQNNKIMKALLYPAVVLIITIVITIILLTLVIPQFAIMFENFGATLPNYTQWIINLSNWLNKFWAIITIIIFSIITCIKIIHYRSIKLQQLLDQIMLNTPLIKNILTNSIVSRLTNTLGLMTSSGIPLLKAMEITASTIGNHRYRSAIQKTLALIISGETLHGSLKKQNLFPAKMIRLVELGEEIGRLEFVLKEISAIYNEELNNITDNLNTLLEPAITLVLGIIIGGLVIGMYLPIFRLGSVM